MPFILSGAITGRCTRNYHSPTHGTHDYPVDSSLCQADGESDKGTLSLASGWNGVGVFSPHKLMVHADLQVLCRFLAQTTEDIAQAHRIGSPVDNNKL